MFAGQEEKYGGRKKKACLRKAWSRGDKAVEEQRPSPPGSSAGLYAKEAAGILLIFQKHHSERGSPARAG